MCGIVYAKSFKNESVNNLIVSTFLAQEGRGMDGYGFVAISKDGIRTVWTTQRNDVLDKLVDKKMTEIMFHHRWPTSTDNNVRTNHPIIAIDTGYEYNYYMIHNGVIMNDNYLKGEHEKLGIKYSTEEKDGRFNDSECLLHELALQIEGIKEESEFDVNGSLAFVLIQTDKMNKPVALHFGRNSSSPLNILRTDERVLISSEGEGVEIESQRWYTFDYKTRQTTGKKFYFGTCWSSSGTNGFRSYNDDIFNRWPEEDEFDSLVRDNSPLLQLPTRTQPKMNPESTTSRQAYEYVKARIYEPPVMFGHMLSLIDVKGLNSLVDFCSRRIKFYTKELENVLVKNCDREKVSDLKQKLHTLEANRDEVFSHIPKPIKILC